MNAILLVHLGPVQDFIASARRCRDLWYGSRLLSELARAAATGMRDHLEANGVDASDEAVLVFPGALPRTSKESDTSAESGPRSVANKIQLTIPLDGLDGAAAQQRVTDVAEAGRAAMKRQLDELAGELLDALQETATGRAHLRRGEAERQIADLMEYMWVAVRLTGDAPDAYASARALAEQHLAARKATRDWGQAPATSLRVPKSSLDGQRESVIHENAYDAVRAGKLESSRLRRDLGVGPAERLCGVGLLKRKGRDPAGDAATGNDDVPPFHSAAHIASASARARLWHAAGERPDVLEKRWDTFVEALEAAGVRLRDLTVRAGSRKTWSLDGAADGAAQGELPRTLPRKDGMSLNVAWDVGLDGVVLYPERLRVLLDEYADAERDPASEELRRNAERAQRQLLSAAGLSEPNPYFAMILADGDRMGEALGRMRTPAEHRAFSEALERAFAAKAGDVVERHGGSLLYAGGDDVLAIVPLATSLACARGLKELFDSAMKEAMPAGHPRPTLSVGLAVAHMLEPFANVRALAQQAEHLAKHRAGRNALAVVVSKRGGAPREVHGRWDGTVAGREGTETAIRPLDERLIEWGRIQHDGSLPRGFAHHLEDVAESLAPRAGSGRLAVDAADSPDPEATRAMVRALVQRVIERRVIDSTKRQSLGEDLVRLFDDHVRLAPDNDPYAAVRAMAHEFQIAVEFQRALDEATPGDAGAAPHLDTTPVASKEVQA